MKTIGLLGGISAASTQKYYATILDKYYKEHKDYYYPEMIINSLNFQYFTDLEDQDRTEECINYITRGIQALEAAGAEFVAMTRNQFVALLDNYEVDGVILGCTELPLLLQSYHKPLLDSLNLQFCLQMTWGRAGR